MILTIVAAAADNDVIGNANQLLYRLPKDFDRMKNRTKGRPLIMGRKTHESIGRPLPGRRNIVVSRNADRKFFGCEMASSLKEAIEMAEKGGADEAIIFGGADIYRQAMPLADRIVLTRIHASPEGDAFFPEINPFEWKEVFREEHEADASHPVPFTFIDYERVKS